MSKLKIKTKERRFETARDLYGIFFEDINRAGDGGLYPEMLRNRSFEDSVLPEGYIQQEDGIHVKTVSGWLDEFCNGDRNTGMVYTQCKDGTGTDGYPE